MYQLLFKTVLDFFSLLKGNKSFFLSGEDTRMTPAPDDFFCISNSFLRVMVNRCTGRLDVFNATGNKISLKCIIPSSDLGNPIKRTVVSPVFGKGISLLFVTGGDFITFTLFTGQPFLFVRQTGGTKPCGPNFTKTQSTISLELDFETPIVQLDILGQGGRVTSGNNPACYVLMTMTDCFRGNQIVCGWLAHEKRNAVLKSEIINNCIRIKVYSDSSWIGEENAPLETLVIGCFQNVPVLVNEVLQSDWKNKISMKPGIALLLTASGMVQKIAGSAFLY